MVSFRLSTHGKQKMGLIRWLTGGHSRCLTWEVEQVKDALFTPFNFYNTYNQHARSEPGYAFFLDLFKTLMIYFRP